MGKKTVVGLIVATALATAGVMLGGAAPQGTPPDTATAPPPEG